MIISTTFSVPGKRITEILGLVKGNTIRVRHIGKDILALLKHMIGGEIGEYTKMLAESREQSIDRMIKEAKAINADAILGIRFTTSAIMGGAAELLVYGTAVKLEDE